MASNVKSLVGGSVRSRLLLVVIGALLPVTIFAVWQGWLANNNSRQLITDRLRANAWEVAQSEHDPFIIARHAMTFAAQQPQVVNSGPNCSAVLASALRGAEGVINFVRTDATGRARCSVLPFTDGQDLSRDRWWIESQGKTGIVISSPQIGRISGRSVLIMVLPLFTKEGRFDGTLSAGISLEQLAESLDMMEKRTRGQLFVADRSGALVMQAGREMFAALPGVVRAQSDPIEITARDGSSWTYVSAPLFAPDLFVVYAEPNRSLLASQIQDTRFSILLQVVTLLIASLAIWFGTQNLILRWLKDLQQLAVKFGGGNFDGEREHYATAPQEISQLSETLHEMASSIESHEHQLRDALTVETGLTREVHHRVKNSLQIVTSLLSLQGQNLTDPKAIAAIEQARARIGAMLLIHNLLYAEGSGGERGQIAVSLLLQGLCGQVRTAFRERHDITLDWDASVGTLNIDQAVPTALFTIEALTNAFQHGYLLGKGGTVKVAYTEAGSEATLSISDNGSGFAKAATQARMGIDLMQALATQLDGAMEIKSSKKGSILTLRFTVISPDLT